MLTDNYIPYMRLLFSKNMKMNTNRILLHYQVYNYYLKDSTLATVIVVNFFSKIRINYVGGDIHWIQ